MILEFDTHIHSFWLAQDEEAEKKKSKEKLFYSNILNVGNKNEPNECQNNVHNEA